MSKRCHDCEHLKRTWTCTAPLPMHVEDVAARWTPNHDTHAEQCDAFGHRERRTSAYFQNPRARIAILSLFRAQCLWDDLGDAGNDLETLAKLAGIDLPRDEESGAVDLDALEAMGAVSLRELLQRPQEPRG